MEEGRPLKEVRAIMAAEHGFEASTRAYRMYFDSLGWKKNTSVKSRRAQKQSVRSMASQAAEPMQLEQSPEQAAEDLPTNRQSSSTTDISPSLRFHLLTVFGITISTGLVNAIEILSIIKGAPPLIGLQILLLKWQAGGPYLGAFQQYITDNLQRFDLQHRPTSWSIFQAIEENIDNNEKFLIAKSCMEADLELCKLKSQGDINGTLLDSSLEQTEPFWDKATTSASWIEARFHLIEGARSFIPKSDLLFSSAFIVIAENFLQRLKILIDSYMGRVDLNATETEEVAQARTEYLGILKDFDKGELEVETCWYKYALRVNEWDRASVKAEGVTLRYLLEKAEEDRDKALRNVPTTNQQCISRGTTVLAQIDNSDEISIPEFGKTDGNRNSHQSSSSSDPQERSWSPDGREDRQFPSAYTLTSPDNMLTGPDHIPASRQNDEITSDQLDKSSTSSATNKAPTITSEDSILDLEPEDGIRFLYDRWASGKSISSHVHDLLEEDLNHTSLFCPSLHDAENIFDLIDQTVKPADKISFTAKVLSACEDFPKDMSHVESPSFKWWLSLYTSTNVKDFQDGLELQPIHLTKVMSAKGIELLLNCTTKVVVTGLLDGLSDDIILGQGRASQKRDNEDNPFDEKEYNNHCEQFVELLKIDRFKKSEFAQPWYVFLLDMLE